MIELWYVFNLLTSYYSFLLNINIVLEWLSPRNKTVLRLLELARYLSF